MKPEIPSIDSFDGITEHGDFRISADASALGLAPGIFPEAIPATIGNGMPFIRVGGRARDGVVTYRQSAGVFVLNVWND